MLLQYSPSAIPLLPQQEIVWIFSSSLNFSVEIFPRPTGKIVTQLPRIFLLPFYFFFFFFFLSQSYLPFYLGGSSLIIRSVQQGTPLNMMTDVFLCSSSLICNIINGNAFTAETSLCCSKTLPVIFFFPSFALVSVSRFLLWFLLLPPPPVLKAKQGKIWQELLEKETVG